MFCFYLSTTPGSSLTFVLKGGISFFRYCMSSIISSCAVYNFTEKKLTPSKKAFFSISFPSMKRHKLVEFKATAVPKSDLPYNKLFHILS